MRGLFQPVVFTMPRHRLGFDQRHCHKPTLDEILVEALLEPTRRSQFPPRDNGCCPSGRQCPEFQPRWMHRMSASVKKPWVRELDMSGFNPGDINIKIDGNSLIVHARKEIKQCENFDVTERKRVVTIPDGVDKKRIMCRINRMGHFVIKGTFECETKKSDKCSKSQASTEMEAEQTEKQPDSPEEQACGLDGEKPEEFEESRPGREYIVSEMTDDSDAESDKTSVMSLADFIVNSLTDGGKSPSPRSGSPVPSEDFVILADSKDNAPNVDTENNDDKELDSRKESTEVAVVDGNKSFNVKLNLKDYPNDNISVRCKDETLIVDAKREWKDGDMLRSQSVHRMYQLPENAEKNEARASVDGEGMFSITVPITEKQTDEEIDITVEQE